MTCDILAVTSPDGYLQTSKMLTSCLLEGGDISVLIIHEYSKEERLSAPHSMQECGLISLNLALYLP